MTYLCNDIERRDSVSLLLLLLPRFMMLQLFYLFMCLLSARNVETEKENKFSLRFINIWKGNVNNV